MSIEIAAPPTEATERPAGTTVKPRSRRRTVKRALAITGSVLGAVIVIIAIYAGVAIYKIDHAVHHVTVSATLLAKGKNDLLAAVAGPHHHEELYLLHTNGGHTNVLTIPGRLDVADGRGRIVPISSLNVRQPTPIIAALRHIGIPIGQYVGVDLQTVSPTSALGRLASGTTSLTGLLEDPTHTASLAEALASHVYLGPNTSIFALLSLTHIPIGSRMAIPTARDAKGHVVLAVPVDNVLRTFL